MMGGTFRKDLAWNSGLPVIARFWRSAHSAVIQTLVLLFSLEFILINLLVDMLYAVINPSIRYK